MKAVARSDDHLARPVPCQRGPKCFLDRLRTGGRPEYLLQTPPTGPVVHELDQAPAGIDFDRRDGVIGSHWQGWEKVADRLIQTWLPSSVGPTHVVTVAS